LSALRACGDFDRANQAEGRNIGPPDKDRLYEIPIFAAAQAYRKPTPLGANILTQRWMNTGAGRCNWRRSSRAGPASACRFRRKEHLVLDIAMLALGLIFFAATIAYAYACDRL